MSDNKLPELQENQEQDLQDDYAFVSETIVDKNDKKKHPKKQFLRIILLAIVFGVVASFCFYAMSPVFNSWFSTSEEPPRITFPTTEDPVVEDPNPDDSIVVEVPDPDGATDGEPAYETIEIPPLTVDNYLQILSSLSSVAREANRSIVTLYSVNVDDLQRYDYTDTTRGRTGLVIYKTERELLILSDNSLVRGFEQWDVLFVDSTIRIASLKMEDANRGLAVYSVNLTDIPEETMDSIVVAELGNSHIVQRGDFVMAMGNITGFGNGLSYGILSTKEYTHTFADTRHDVLSTDISAASDGSGVLFNQRGEVIGLILPHIGLNSDSRTANAIAISGLRGIITYLSNGEEVPFIGIEGLTVTDFLAEEQGIPHGVFVTQVVVDSPAMRAGVQSGDVIIAFNGVEVNSSHMLQSELLTKQAGDIVTIEAKRMGSDGYVDLEFAITLGVFQSQR